MIREAEKRQLVVLIEQTGGGDCDKEIEVLSSQRLQLTDGLIFSPLGMSSDDAELLNVSYPLVLLGERIFGGPVDHVTMKNVEASQAATRHLIERGCRRIAVIGAHEGELAQRPPRVPPPAQTRPLVRFPARAPASSGMLTTSPSAVANAQALKRPHWPRRVPARSQSSSAAMTVTTRGRSK